MLSSTSSSKGATAVGVAPAAGLGGERAVALALIVGATCILGLTELLTSIGFARISRVERRTHDEIQGAIQLHRTPGGRRKVLLAGNSLLLEGVDMAALGHDLPPAMAVRRVVVTDTNYLDWYFGLRMLFANGSRPDAIVLVLTPSQLISNRFRGDYTANRLVRASDLIHLARAGDLSPTQTASLYLAHYSAFYGARAEIRSWLLGRLMPGLEELQPYLGRFKASSPTADEVRRIAPRRLATLQQLAAGYGTEFMLLVPASLHSAAVVSALAEVGLRVGVAVLEPIAPDAIPPSGFSDGFHLNAKGARTYTAALAPVLQEAILAH